MTTGEQQGALFSLDIPVGLYGANAEQKTLPQLFEGLMLSVWTHSCATVDWVCQPSQTQPELTGTGERSPLDRVRDALRGQRAGVKDIRNLVSNLPYEGLGKMKQPNRYFPGNAIKTTKYTILLFIPMNLFEQFHHLANIYFVCLAILNFVPVVNAFQPEVALVPICVILSLTALKAAWEDFRRYRSDRKLNNTQCFIYSSEKPDKDKVGAGIGSLLLRCSKMRNTDHAVGFVAYAGHETKSMLNNNNGPRYKRSKLERKLNTDVIFCVILIMSLLMATGAAQWVPYLVPGSNGHLDSPSLSGYYMFFTTIILLQVEKTDCVYERKQDGTLTENKMVFRRCSIMGTEYPHKENESEEDVVFIQRPLPPLTGWSLGITPGCTQQHHDNRHRSKVKENAQSYVAFSSPLGKERPGDTG
ncbi:putative phospholipid-transporting ATPase VB [Liparis tanakae]|uniref:Putative phospholipid-transporting ATPase VB n=1 Tax=Liparis tanakae TaxID=230148 RepID=A0A4Z2H9I4_9TELE|nr:putative phospholipid-transporting ATPase VB [Liparis tanakae]